jgi:hypothetical protein
VLAEALVPMDEEVTCRADSSHTPFRFSSSDSIGIQLERSKKLRGMKKNMFCFHVSGLLEGDGITKAVFTIEVASIIPNAG